MLKGTFFKRDRDIFSLFSEQLNKGTFDDFFGIFNIVKEDVLNDVEEHIKRKERAHDDDYFYEWLDYDDISEPEEFQKSFNHSTDLSDKEKEYIHDRCRYFRIYDIISTASYAAINDYYTISFIAAYEEGVSDNVLFIGIEAINDTRYEYYNKFISTMIEI